MFNHKKKFILIFCILIVAIGYQFLKNGFERNLSQLQYEKKIELQNLILTRQINLEEKFLGNMIDEDIRDFSHKRQSTYHILIESLKRSLSLGDMSKLNFDKEEVKILNNHIAFLRLLILQHTFLGEKDNALSDIPEHIDFFDNQEFHKFVPNSPATFGDPTIVFDEQTQTPLKVGTKENGPTKIRIAFEWAEGGYSIQDFVDSKDVFSQCIKHYTSRGFEVMKQSADFGFPVDSNIVIVRKGESIAILVITEAINNITIIQLLPTKKKSMSILDDILTSDRIIKLRK